MKRSVVCLLVCVMSLLAMVQGQQSTVSSHATRHYYSRDLRDPYGRMNALRHTTRASVIGVNTIDTDWAFSLGGAGNGVVDNQYPGSFVKTQGTPSCADDYVVFPDNVTAGVGTQGNLVGLYNVYTGTASSYCPNSVNQTPPTTNATGPSVLFCYAVGTGAITASPALSLDGTKIAVVETGTTAKVHIITWAKQSGSPTDCTTSAIAPPTETVISLSGATNCAAGQNAQRSSVWPDYTNDIGYVGDGNARVWAISGLFKGTPAVKWCQAITGANGLGTPEYDGTTNIYVNDDSHMYSLLPGATGFTLNGSVTLGAANSSKDDPLIDGFGFVYNFVNNDGSGTPSVAVLQTKADLSSTVKVQLGASTTNPIYVGDFNNTYQNSGPTASGAHLYAWGYNNATSGVPTVNGLNFSTSTGVMSTTPFFTNNSKCENTTPLAGTGENMTEFFDTADQLFTSVSVNGRACRWSPPPTNNNSVPGVTVTGFTGGTSGIVVDSATDSSVVQTGNIFFGTANKGNCGGGTNVYCGFKLKQADLSSN